MRQHADCPGFLIDGFPREIQQGLQFEQEVSPPMFNTLLLLHLPKYLQFTNLWLRLATSYQWIQCCSLLRLFPTDSPPWDTCKRALTVSWSLKATVPSVFSGKGTYCNKWKHVYFVVQQGCQKKNNHLLCDLCWLLCWAVRLILKKRRCQNQPSAHTTKPWTFWKTLCQPRSRGLPHPNTRL